MAKKIIREHNATIEERQALFTQAGVHAVNAARAASLPLTDVEGTTIVREECDGTKTIIGTIKPSVPILQKKIKLYSHD
ncbi:MAG: hypothetical protein RBR15_15525 [Sphaerochaeta sp.]|nr:hypothetical protein [Sphaerochaeta sp.]